MKLKLQQYPLFIVLIPVFYLLHLLEEYFPILLVGHLLRKESFLLVLIPLVIFFSLAKSPARFRKMALLLLYAEFIYFFFGAILELLKSFSVTFSRYTWLLPLLLLAGLLLYRLLAGKRFSYTGSFVFFNVLFIVLTLYEIIMLAFLYGSHGSIKNWRNSENSFVSNYRPCDTCAKPDIYYLIFDGYSGNEALQQYWGYSNTAMDSFLTRQGFYVVNHSRSNYNSTPYSVGSELNFDYHPDLGNTVMSTLEFIKGRNTVEHNNFCRLLEKEGYRFYNYSFFPLAQDAPRVQPFLITDPGEIILAQTFWYRFVSDVGWNFGLFHGEEFSAKRKQYLTGFLKKDLQRIDETFTGVQKTLSDTSPSPKFIYGHFLLPHDPYFYDSTGKLFAEEDWFAPKQDKGRYLQQLIYTNKRIQYLLTALRQDTHRKIIIVQGDHGYRSFNEQSPKRWVFNNLSAIYFPGSNYGRLYDSMSNVNTFRIVLNEYFHQELPLLKDSSVYIRLE
jgi:Sulfatase